MTTAKRGRPTRCVEGGAPHVVSVRVTDAELATLQRLARANGCGVADVLRMGAAQLAADAGDDLPLVLTDTGLVIFVR